MKIFNCYLYFFSSATFVSSLAMSNSVVHPPNKVISIDNRIKKYTSSATLNNFISPLVGIIDGIWIGKLGSSEMLAGSGYGDQLFCISYDLTSFVSPIITPEIAELHVLNYNEEMKELISISLCLSVVLGCFVSSIVWYKAETITSLLIAKESEIFKYALMYLKYRVLSLPFSLINSTAFGILRGMEKFNIAVWINTKAQFVNMVLDPILMFHSGFVGIIVGSIVAEIYCSVSYLQLLFNMKMIEWKWNRDWKFKKQWDIVKKGTSIQLKNMNYNFMSIIMNQKIMTMTNPSKTLAAHIIVSRLYQLGSIFHSGLSSVSSIIIPVEKIENHDKLALQRLLYFANRIGIIQCLVILFSNPLIHLFSNDPVVVKNCFSVTKYLSILVYLNSIASVYEGALQGYKKYHVQTIISFLSFSSMFLSLKFCKTFAHVWISILVMASVRLCTSKIANSMI